MVGNVKIISFQGSKYVTSLKLCPFSLQTFEEIRAKMLTKGKNFLETKMQSRSKIAKLGAQHINDGSVS